jgi:hypothetical protein
MANRGASAGCSARFISAMQPAAPCDAAHSTYLTSAGDENLAQYQQAYSCFRGRHYMAALRHIDRLRPVTTRETIQARLARAAILHQLGRTAEAIRLLQSAQRLEAVYTRTDLGAVRAPTGGEELLLRGRPEAFERFLPAALAFEFVQKDDALLRRGVAAARSGDMCSASKLFASSVDRERSSTARWLNGGAAFVIGDRGVAVESWLDQIFEPGNTAEQTFNRVQWSAVSLIIATHHEHSRGPR